MESTHIFKLLSGPECEVREMGGKHQKILTKGGVSNLDAKLVTCLTDLIVRIGSKTHFTEAEIREQLLVADRKKILFEVRQFSMDFDPEFKFKYKYQDKDGRKAEIEEVADISKGVPFTPFYQQWAELADINKKVRLTLPRCGKELEYTMLDFLGEQIGLAIPEKERSVNTALSMRNPVELTQKENAVVPIQSRLEYGLKDMEFLRSNIKEHEGRIDTEVMFRHPVKDEDVIIDMTSQLAFFFPSEAL